MSKSKQEEMTKALGARVADKFVDFATRGLGSVVEIAMEAGPYAQQLFSAVGSAVIMSTVYDLYDDDVINREQFLELRSTLNKSSHEFLKTNYDIVVESTKIIGNKVSTASSFVMPKVKQYLDSINAKCDDTKWCKNMKDYLIEKGVVSARTPLRLTSATSTTSTKPKCNFNKKLELEIRDKFTAKLNKSIPDDPSTYTSPEITKLSQLNTLNSAKAYMRQNAKFVSTVENTHYSGTAIAQIGILTGNDDVVKVGTGIIGVAGIATGIGATLGYGTPACLAMGPLGWTTLVLGGAIALTQALKRTPQNNTLQQTMQAFGQLLNQMRTEMHERFNQIIRILNANQQQFLNQFSAINSNVDSVMDFLRLIDTDIKTISSKIQNINNNINDNFETIMRTLTLDKIVSKREKIQMEITRMRIETRDNFVENMSKLISSATTINELLSGYNDVVSSNGRILQRFGKVRSEFNINSCVQIVRKICLKTKTVFQFNSSQILGYIKKMCDLSADYSFTECLVGIFINTQSIQNILDESDSDSHSSSCSSSSGSRKRYHYIPINNFGIWSLLVVDNVLNQMEYFGKQSYFLKNIIMNDVSNVTYNNSDHMYDEDVSNSKITLHILSKITTDCTGHTGHTGHTEHTGHTIQRKKDPNFSKLIADISSESPTFNIGGLQNPLFFSLYLNVMIEKICEQKNSDGRFPEGFLSIPMYKELLCLTHQIAQYYDFVSICRTPELYTLPMIEYNNARTEVVNSIKTYYENSNNTTFSEKLVKLNEIYRKNITDECELFRTQQIIITPSYADHWFLNKSKHVCGKFCQGSEDNQQDGGRYNNYQNHMNGQVEAHKNNGLAQARRYISNLNKFLETTTNTVKVKNIFVDTIGTVPKYMPQFIMPKIRDNSRFPILRAKPEMINLIPNDVFILQMMNPQKYIISFEYVISEYSDKRITTGTKLRLNILCGNSCIVSKFYDYDPLFYTGAEAVLWFWEGGHINQDVHNCSTSHYSDYSCDNRWDHTIWWPNYSDRAGVNINAYIFSYTTDKIQQLETYITPITPITPGSKITLTNVIRMEIDDIYKEHNKNMKNSDELAIVFKKLDAKYHTVCALLACANVDETKVFSPSLVCIKIHNSQQILSYAESSRHVLNYSLTTFKETPVSASTFANSSTSSHWMEYGNTTNRFCKLLKDIEGCVTERFSASEKMEFNAEVTSTLLKIIEVVQHNPEELKGLDISGFISRATRSFEEKISRGIETTFKNHIKESLLTLTDSQRSALHMLC